MPNPYPTALRERAVRAYEGGADTYAEVAARFSIHLNTLVRWVQGARDRGTVLPAPRGGGWYSPVDIPVLHALIKERPDRTTAELTRADNERAAPEAQVHRSSVLRALQRSGYVFKKTPAAGRARQPGSPGATAGIPRLDGPRRYPPRGLS
jgi:transposase